MPNWCDCDLLVRGSSEDLGKFKDEVKGKEEAIETGNIVPYPKIFAALDKNVDAKGQAFYNELCVKDGVDPELEPVELTDDDNKALLEAAMLGFNLDNDGYNQGGYQWCNMNWGSKWGICHSEIVGEAYDHIRYSFKSPWNPPLPVIVKMGGTYSNLRFELRYYESGAGYQGHLVIEYGEVTINWANNEYSGDRGG